MSATFRFAFRSVTRRLGRSGASIGVIGLCVAALATKHSITEAIERFSHAAVVETRTGSVVVRPAGAFDEIPLGTPSTLSAETVARIRAHPGVTAAAGRLHVSAQLSDGRTDTTVVVRGVDPVEEPRVCPRFSRELRAGSAWLSGANEGVVGYALADALNLHLGQTITLSSTGTARSNALELRVVAISESGLALENRRVITVPLSVAQALAGLDDGVSEVGLATSLEPEKLRDEIARAVDGAAAPAPTDKAPAPTDDAPGARALHGTAAAAPPGDAPLARPLIEVRTWQDVHPLARDNVERQHRLDGFATLVLLSVVLAALLALGLLAVDERTREVGTLMSFGMRRAQIASMFFYEGVFLGVFGALLGLGVAALATAWLSSAGIPVHHMGSAHPAMLRPALSLVTVGWGSALALVASACTGALVAWRVTRLKPVEATRA